jgi:hypothetical protein
VRFASSGLRQAGNTAEAAGAADLGCGSCRSSTDGATAVTVSNAAGFSATPNTLTPGMLPNSIMCACATRSNGGCTDWKELSCRTVLARLLTAFLQESQAVTGAAAAAFLVVHLPA